MKYSLENVIATRPNKTIYRDGNYKIKVFNEEYKKSDILNEALNHARIEETGLNVPALYEVKMIDNRWAIVTEYIEGKTLAQLMEEDPDSLDEYFDLFVSLQLSVHAKRSPLLTKIKDKMKMKISQTDLDATTRYDLHTRVEGMPKHNKVCHGDFNPANVIITKDGTPYIIDWAHATQGNGSADAARTFLLFSLSGRADLAEKYLNIYCKKSDTAKQYVQKWIPIVAASQSVKGKPEEKALLMSWVDVFDYE